MDLSHMQVVGASLEGNSPSLPPGSAAALAHGPELLWAVLGTEREARTNEPRPRRAEFCRASKGGTPRKWDANPRKG